MLVLPTLPFGPTREHRGFATGYIDIPRDLHEAMVGHVLASLADGTTLSVSVSSETKMRPSGKTVADLSVGTRVTAVIKNGITTGVVVLPT